MAITIAPTLAKIRDEILQLQKTVNRKGTFTCTANADSTIVYHNSVGSNSVVVLQAASASAANEQALGTVWVQTHTRSFTVWHSNTDDATREFSFSVSV